MPWYDDLQRQVEKCASSENMMRELLGEIGVEEMIAHNEGYALPRRRRLFNTLRQRLFRS
ncbi:hypothetical protein COO59_17295 [Mixta theicola]|uniref:Uncharacterized protein n=1 Tax=Mixta theicola TaxID=1458355 RepID=A0A2K1Q646_9GAMM|nr:hypothetical protein [Mixta theicola]PNS10512.1 hypothetical protein COO59_17295 [Mixta theicola]GLR08232.1 hypothetical protein GCM10007905_09510 [Mixta theicola]